MRKAKVGFEILDDLQVGRRDPLHPVEDVRKRKTSGIDAVVLSTCVQVPSLAAIQPVEGQLGVPVTSTAICAAWRMLDHLNAEPVVLGAGVPLRGRYSSANAAGRARRIG